MTTRRFALFITLLTLLLAATAATRADAALAVVGTTPGATTSAADTLVITRTVGANTLLVACAGVWNASGTTMTVVDGDGSYTQAFTRAETLGPDTSGRVFCHYRNNTTAGSKSVIFDPVGAAADINGFVTEISGAAISSPLDVTVTGEAAVAAAASFTPSITTATLAQANNIVIGIMAHSLTQITLAPGATFTEIAEQESQNAAQAYNAQYKIVSATTAVVVPWAQANNTGGAAGAWIAGAAVFKELVSTDTTPPTTPTSVIATAPTPFRIATLSPTPRRPRLAEAP
jgi:hypothetical protein